MTHTQTAIIDDIFQALRACPLRMSQRQFSISWLGRSAGYLAYLKSSGAIPDRACLLLLRCRLERLAEILCGSEQFVHVRAKLLILTLKLALSLRCDTGEMGRSIMIVNDAKKEIASGSTTSLGSSE